MDDHSFHRCCLLFCISLLLSLKPAIGATLGSSDTRVRCIESERQALLEFKQGLVDEYGVLSSWGNREDTKECCKWRGVKCSNMTGHVILLDLHQDFSSWDNNRTLRGEVSRSILELQHLGYLDLSHNHFRWREMRENIGFFYKLEHLNLSETGFDGVIPPQLGNLTNLHTLDISYNSLTTNNLGWLSQLRFLRQLDLSEVWLNESDWQQVIFSLPSIEDLRLDYCELGDVVIPSLPLLPNASSKSLSVIQLSHNHLTSSIYSWLFNISKNLVHIDLSYNHLEGSIPDAFGEMISLQHMDLRRNSLIGGIPKSFQNLSHLRLLHLHHNSLNESLQELLQKLSRDVEKSLDVLVLCHNQLYGPLTDITRFSSLRILYLHDNRLSGRIPESIGQLSKLEHLAFSSNLLEGTISEVHFSKLSNLKLLVLSYNSLIFNMSLNWVPTFQLQDVYLSNCNMGPHFPQWLRTQHELFELDLSLANISDTMPNWFWDLSPKLEYLNLSHNQISGRIPQLSKKFHGYLSIDLSFNNFSGPILSIPHSLTLLSVHKNMFEGSTSFLCETMLQRLTFLDLSNNKFSGNLPNCWKSMEVLYVLDLASNNFSGPIPRSLGFLHNVKILRLHNNSFIGELPSSLKGCTQLQVIDIGGNKLRSKIPAWIGMYLSRLAILSLRSNKFYGEIPQDICQISYIQVLDLSSNNITAKVPNCLYNFTYLAQESNFTPLLEFSCDMLSRFCRSSCGYYMDNLLVLWKNQASQFTKNLRYLKLIDLSSNKLVGQIPKEIATLRKLISLNLSANYLTGNIIQNIDQLEMLESLDLSRNQFSGEIPVGLASLNYLSFVNLSFNKLSGKIPSGTQLQSFNASMYMGNNGLCGPPLKKCPSDASDSRPTDHVKNDEIPNKEGAATKELYMGIACGFPIGFLGIVCVLFTDSWRIAYFRFLDSITGWFYVRVMVYFARLRRKLSG